MESFLRALSKQIKNAFSSSDTLLCRSMLEAQIQSPQKLLMKLCANVAGLMAVCAGMHEYSRIGIIFHSKYIFPG